jgi:sortase A
MLGLLQSFEEVSRQSAALQAEAEATRRAQFVPPTPTPLINLAAVVLPGGHTFRDDEAIFNLEEVPAQYRDQFVNFAASLPVRRPTPSREGPVRIRIPRIGVDSQVVTGDDWEALKLGVGHHIGSANPGERGNMVLSAHNDIYGEIFRHLDRLLPGDEIIVSTWTKDYTYVVQPNNERGVVKGHQIVAPTDVWVLAGGGDTRRLTLISCYPYRVNTKRIVVFAVLKE